MIIVLPHLISKSFSAVTIYPFIFLKKDSYKQDYTLINHEFIHLQQQKEMLWFAFFLWYILEFFIRLVYYRNAHSAYKNISFEREAYYYENDLDYLQHRRFYAFLKFL